MRNKITDEESLLYACLATTQLIAALHNSNFLESDFYKSLNLEPNIKLILDKSGIGNPATLQMFFYTLLVIPKSLWEKNESNNHTINQINDYIKNHVEKSETKSSYKKDAEQIDYARHIRNAVSHSRCDFKKENNVKYVYFYDCDNNKNSKCTIKISTKNAGNVLNELLSIIIKWCNAQNKNTF